MMWWWCTVRWAVLVFGLSIFRVTAKWQTFILQLNSTQKYASEFNHIWWTLFSFTLSVWRTAWQRFDNHGPMTEDPDWLIASAPINHWTDRFFNWETAISCHIAKQISQLGELERFEGNWAELLANNKEAIQGSILASIMCALQLHAHPLSNKYLHKSMWTPGCPSSGACGLVTWVTQSHK